MNNIDKVLGTYTGIMTTILTIGALMTITKSSPILLIAIFPLTAYMVVQGVKALYALKYGPQRSPTPSNSSTLAKLKANQQYRTSLTTKSSLRYFFAQNSAGFLVTIALLVIAVTSLALKAHLEEPSLISPIPQQETITFNVR